MPNEAPQLLTGGHIPEPYCWVGYVIATGQGGFP
jgi:hypothetical protein